MAAVKLIKGGNVSLEKQLSSGQTLKRIIVSLRWEERDTNGEDFDIDASAFMLDKTEKVPNDSHFIFYNNLISPCGKVMHKGDNLIGSKADEVSDSEQIEIDLEFLPSTILSIVFGVTIHDAARRKQNFGQVPHALIRVINAENSVELVNFDLTEGSSIETAMIFGEVYKYVGEWKFRAIGQGFTDGLYGLAKKYGVNVQKPN